MAALQTGIFSELLAEQRQAVEKRDFIDASGLNPGSITSPEAWLLEALGAGPSDAGVRVSEVTALGISTVHACVDLISSSIASLPAYVYERQIKNGRQVRNIAYDHLLFDLIHFQPNPDMSSSTLRKVMAVSFLLFGNAYAELFRDASNNITAIWPCSPYATWPFIVSQGITLPPEPWRPYPVTLPAGTMAFKTVGVPDDPTQMGRERVIAPDDMLHIPGLSFSGRIGERFVHLARPTLGKGIALGRFSNRFFSNYASPSGILEITGTPEQREKARASWIQRQNADGAHSVAVTPPGTKFTQVSISPEASQMLQTAQFVRAEIAGLFHVPVTMLGDIDKGKANAEQLAVEFLSYCLSPWLEVMRQEFKRKLFPNPDFAGVGRRPGKNNFFIDFDTHRLLRPTAADRQSYYQTGFTTGSLSPNDIREMEGLNPRDDDAGNTYYVPVNVQDPQNPLRVPSAPASTDPADQGDDPPTFPEANSLVPVYSRVFRDALGRVLSREKLDQKAFHRTFQPVIYGIADMLCQQQDPEFRSSRPLPGDVVTFANDFIGGMFKRSSDWKSEKADELSAAELERAIGAIARCVTNSTSKSFQQRPKNHHDKH
jgi:HK97 family phage portal protein